MKNPIKPYYGKCQGCNRDDLLDVGHTCTSCFALMDPIERIHHMRHVQWVNAGRPPEDTTDPWAT